MVEPDAVERREPAARRRDLEDAEPSAFAEHAPQLADARFEILDVAHAEADGGGVERRVVEREREHVASHEFDLRRLPPRALEHLVGEVEADDVGAALTRTDREVAGAAACVERPVVAANGLLDRDAPPAPVETRRHHVVHHVVDRRDPVEHAADAVRREPSGFDVHCPHRFVSVFSRPSWSSARPTTKSTRSSTVSAPW